MYTLNVNQKLELANFNYNKTSFLASFIIAVICCFILGVEHLKNGSKLLALLFFGYSFFNLYIAFYVYEIKQISSKNVENMFNVLYSVICCFFPIYLIIGYYNGIPIKTTQKIYFIAIGILTLIFSNRLFKSKEISYLFAFIYSGSIIFMSYLYYYSYGFNEFFSNFDSFDFAYSVYAILMIFSISYSKNTLIDYYNKAIWENDFMTEKFNSMFKNLITPIIKIDKANFNIEFNDNFIVFLVKILDNKEDLNGFLDISESSIEYFKKETKISENYLQFIKTINTRNENSYSTSSSFSRSSLNNLNLFETNEFKNDMFYKRLYYLNKIFKKFNSEKIKSNSPRNFLNSLNIKSIKRHNPNLFDILFSEADDFNEEEKYKKLGNFFINSNKYSSNNDIQMTKTTFDILFRKSSIFGVEFIDILFYDTSCISQIEKEKANSEVESRKQYLSIVSDKFMTPIQVLLLSINNIAKILKDKNKAISKEFEEIQNLGKYIQVMNQDITCVSRMESGLDVNFESFKTVDLFNFSKEIIDLLIRNNATKCYAIKTKLIISNEVPKILNSDIDRLRQVMINFLTNAYKFTLAGDIKMIVSVKESNILYDEIGVSINDTGIGIRDDYKEILKSQIDEIPDLKRLHLRGNGLGLLMCNIIISRLGRNINYEPKKSGSIFSFSFYNIKSKEIEDIIKNNKFHKIKDLIDESSRCEASLKLTTKIVDFKKFAKFLDSNKRSNSSKDVNKHSSQLNIIYEDQIIDDHTKDNNLESSPKNIITKINTNKIIKTKGDEENNEIFDVDHIRNLNNVAVDSDGRLNSKRSTRKKRASSFYNPPTEKKPSLEGNFPFDDSVFDFYRIKKSDSIFFDSKSIDIDSLAQNLAKNIILDENTNKYSALFNEISGIFRVNHKNEDFLKIYENFKPYLKFFHSCLKEASMFKSLELQGNSRKIKDKNNIKRILIVDDNKPILKALKNVTSIAIKDLNLTNKLEIIMAYDGVDALALFKIDHYTSQSIKYIISDHNMSMMDGCDFIKLVINYKLGRDIKLYISSTDNEIIKTNNIKNVNFINKPVRKSDIKTLLSSFVA